MKYVYLLLVSNVLLAQSEFVFINGFEKKIIVNDTGVVWAGHSTQANNTICESNMMVPQDCNFGRDDNEKTNDNEDGAAGFSFTKIDENGGLLQNTAMIWSCVKDNVTGLTWEIKTLDKGVHNKDNKYLWGGLTSIGINHPNQIGVYFIPSWNELILDSNTNSYCGKNNWRVPTVEELSSLGNYSVFLPAIDINYFPYTLNEVRSIFWTSSPTAGMDNGAWSVYFKSARIKMIARDSSQRVRLVSED